MQPLNNRFPTKNVKKVEKKTATFAFEVLSIFRKSLEQKYLLLNHPCTLGYGRGIKQDPKGNFNKT